MCIQDDQKTSDQNLKGSSGDEYKRITSTMRVWKYHFEMVKSAGWGVIETSGQCWNLSFHAAISYKHAALYEYWISWYPSDLWNCEWKWGDLRKSCTGALVFVEGLCSTSCMISSSCTVLAQRDLPTSCLLTLRSRFRDIVCTLVQKLDNSVFLYWEIGF